MDQTDFDMDLQDRQGLQGRQGHRKEDSLRVGIGYVGENWVVVAVGVIDLALRGPAELAVPVARFYVSKCALKSLKSR